MVLDRAASWCDLNDVPAGARNVDGGSNEGSRRLCTRRSALCQVSDDDHLFVVGGQRPSVFAVPGHRSEARGE
jgi:hypothetical protein